MPISPLRHSDIEHSISPLASSTPSLFNNVGRLPPSLLPLLSKALPSSMLAVLPSHLLPSTNLQPNQTILVNDRLSKLLVLEDLIGTPPGSNFPSVLLLSPSLRAILPSRPISIIPALSVPPAKSVTLTPLIPQLLPTQTAASAAALAKSALIGRDARPYDIIPAASTLWLSVESIDGKGPITHETRVAISLRAPMHAVMCPSSRISSSMRDWAIARWLRPPICRLPRASDRLAAAVDDFVRLVLLQGLDRDVDHVLHYLTVGRVVSVVRLADKKELIEAVARTELAGGGGIVLLGVSDGAVDFVLSSVARRERLRDHLGARKGGTPVCFILTCQDKEEVDQRLLQCVDVEVVISKADDAERGNILREAVEESGGKLGDDVVELVRMSTGFATTEVHDLGVVFANRGLHACREAVKLFGKGKISIDTGGVSWGDVGGLEAAKKQILQLVDMSNEDSHIDGMGENVLRLRVNINRRVGVLLYGPPGTGKTLLARAVAGECGCSFISVKGPELLDMYVGESEKNVRDVFERATMAAPCVIFFDELDALAPSRGRSADSGGVADRVVSQLLAEMDDVVTRNDIFVIAASNRPDLVDPGLLRPGRLDKLIYVTMPCTRKEQAVILQAQTRKFCLKEDIDFEDILSFAPPPPTISGADIYSLAAGAWMNAAKREVDRKLSVDDKSLEGGSGIDIIENAISRTAKWADIESTYRGWFGKVEDEKCLVDRVRKVQVSEKDYNSKVVVVTRDDFVASAKELAPSLTPQQLHEYDELRSRLETGL